ncbi:MAG TPA: exo-alpha-sialidase [Mycobacteriales bacterium]|nr:exo-alpha-sialidase [Mycobacteriales bacterium]
MRRRAALTGALVALAVVAAAAPAPGAGGPEPDSSDHRASPPGGGSRNEPTIAIHPRNPLVIASASHEYLNSQTIVSANLSLDGGVTWPHRAQLPSLGNAPWTGDPHVAYDAGGRLHAAYLSVRVGNLGVDYSTGGVVVARSADGRRWPSRPTVVVQNRKGASGCAFADFPALAADPRPAFRDRLYVAWQSLEYDDADCSEGYRHPVYLARSADGGRTWSPPVKAPLAVHLYPYIPTLTVGPAGHVHLTLASSPAESSNRCASMGQIDVHVLTSTDGGRSLRDSVALDGVCTPGIVHAGPVGVNSLTGGTWRLPASTNTAVDARSGTLVTVVGAQDPSTRQLVVHVAASDDGGTSWVRADDVPVPRIDNAHFPRIAAGPHGMALLYLAQRPGGSFVAHGTYSRDAGATWAPPTALATAPSVLPHPVMLGFIGDYLGLAVGRDGLAHPVWTDLRELGTGQSQAIYTRSFRT